MSQQARKVAVLAVVACGVALFFALDLDRYFTLEAVKANRDRLLAFTESHFAQAVVLFIVLYCVIVALSVPGAAIMTLTGGFLFGTWLGAAFVNIGATAGATLAFLAARYVLREWVERRFGSRLDAIQEGFKRNAFSYLLTLRLIPLIPFFVINLVSGLTRVNVGTYVAATAIGIIPGTIVFAYAGRQLGTLNSVKDILSPSVLMAFGLLIVLALVPVLYQRLQKFSGVRHGA